MLWLNFNSSSQKSPQTLIQPEHNIKEEVHTPSSIEYQKISTHEQENKINLDSPFTEKSMGKKDSNDHMTHLLELYKQQKKDPRTLLKIESIPEEQQAQLKEWLNQYKKQGFISSDDVAFDYIEQQESQASFINLNDPNITINLQDIEKTSFAKYKYQGAVLDGQGVTNIDSTNITGLTRLYIDNNGAAISLRESSINSLNQGAIMVDKFVSNEIHDYPVTIMKSCAPSGRCISKLTLMTSDKIYEISIKDEKSSKSDEYLFEMASSLDLPTLPEQQM